MRKIEKSSRLFFQAATLILGLSFVVAMPIKIQAADSNSICLDSAKNKYKVGKKFKLEVFVRVPDLNKPINAVSGKIIFPANKLEAKSVSTSQSIITYWQTKALSRTEPGKINFAGVLLSPGFNGEKGKLFSVIFKVKKSGKASVKIGKTMMLLNDGKGTKAPHSVCSAKFKFYKKSNLVKFVFQNPKGSQRLIEKDKEYKVNDLIFTFENFPESFKSDEKAKKYFNVQLIKRYPKENLYKKTLAESQILGKYWKITTNVKNNFKAKLKFKYSEKEWEKFKNQNSNMEVGEKDLILKYYNNQTERWEIIYEASHNLKENTFKIEASSFKELNPNLFVIGTDVL